MIKKLIRLLYQSGKFLPPLMLARPSMDGAGETYQTNDYRMKVLFGRKGSTLRSRK